MTRKVDEIAGALARKGFRSENAKHHVMYWFYANGRKTSVRTRISFGEKEIGNPLLSRMANEMRMNRQEFLKFVSCEITGEDYLQRMVDSGQVASAGESNPS